MDQTPALNERINALLRTQSASQQVSPVLVRALQPAVFQVTPGTCKADAKVQYNLGKLAPLQPTYFQYFSKDPPQRIAVNDMRLSASQRSRSCYSPEMLGGMGSGGSRPSTSVTVGTAGSYTAAAPLSHRGSSVMAGASPPHSPRRSPSSSSQPQASRSCTDLHRPLTGTSPMCSPRTPATPLGASPSRRALSPSREPSRELPYSELNHYYKLSVTSTLSTGGVFIPSESDRMPGSVFKRASSAVVHANMRSHMHAENMPCPLRNGHGTTPTEREMRACMRSSHEASLKLKFKDRVARWGI